MTLRAADLEALRGWGEHEHPVAADVVARLEAAGLVRVIALATEREPLRMLTTAGFEKRDALRERGKAR